VRLVLLILFRGAAAKALLGIVDILEIRGLRHGLGRRGVNELGRGKELLKGLKGSRILRPVLLGELDRELNVHVAVVVVAVGWHALATDHLDGACRKG